MYLLVVSSFNSLEHIIVTYILSVLKIELNEKQKYWLKDEQSSNTYGALFEV